MNLPSETTGKNKSGKEFRLSETRLDGIWLALARVTWLTLVGCSLLLFFISIPGYFAYLHTVCIPGQCDLGSQLTAQDIQQLHSLGFSLDAYATFKVLVSLLLLGVFVMVGLVVFWRKSDDPTALFGSFSLVLLGLIFNQNVLVMIPPALTVEAEIVALLANASGFIWGYLFPGGFFAPHWMRWIAWLSIPYWILDTFSRDFSNSIFNFVLFLGLLASLVVVQIYRYRRVSNSTERQQTKWVIYGIAVAIGVYIIELLVLFLLLPSFFQLSALFYAIGQSIVSCILLLFPLSIGFAILRYRLYDIDVLINRTLVYGILTTSLVLVYFGCVLGLQFLLSGLSAGNSLAIVASTLAIAALFQPLRQRIQRIIDRRFYRSKYDATRTLASFSATLRNEVDLSQLSDRLLEVVQETMQPAHISLWLRSPESVGKHQLSWNEDLRVSPERMEQ